MSKKKFLIIAAVLIVAGFIAKTVWHQAQINKLARIRSAESAATPKCDTPLVITANGNTWHLRDMTWVTVRLKNGEEVRYSLDSCDKPVLSDEVRSFMWYAGDRPFPGRGGVTITINPSSEHQSKFSASRESYVAQGYSLDFKGEIFPIDRISSETFIFSPDLIKSRDGLPVVFGCDGSLSTVPKGIKGELFTKRCETYYQHPEGFLLSYKFPREAMSGSYQNLPESFPEIDRKVRAYLETQMVK